MWAHGACHLGTALALKERNGARIVATGIGATPLNKADQEALASAASLFDVFEVRDEASFTALGVGTDGPISLGVDDAFLAPPQEAGLSSHKPNLHLCVQVEPLQGPAEAYVPKIAQLLKSQRDEFGSVFVYELHPSDALFWDSLVKAEVQGLERVRFFQLFAEGFRVHEGDLAITTRFHARLLLERLGIRGLFWAGGDDFYSEKNRSLARVGSNWRPMPHDRDILLTDFDFTLNLPEFSQANHQRKIEAFNRYGLL